MKKKLKKMVDKVNKGNNKKSKYKITKAEICFVLVVFIFMFAWSIFMPSGGYGPDEPMRYDVPLYIYHHGKLPLPDNKEVVSKTFNASYAYYPLLLGAIFSAFFMKIVSIFTTSSAALLVAGRFTSVLCGTLFVYFVIKIANILFKGEDKKWARWFMICFTSLIPQLTFLSSYVNNDIIALLGVSIIIYSWLLMMDDKENKKNDYLLALGVSIVMLSYYNAYGFILASVFFFATCFIKKKDKRLEFDFKNFFKRGLVIAGIVLVLCGYLFIRNAVVNKGDMLGMKSFLAACEKTTFPDPNVPPSTRNTPKNLGMSVWESLWTYEYLHTENYISLVQKSFIGVFGPMAYGVHKFVINIFRCIILIGIIGFLFKIKDYLKKKDWVSFYVCLAMGMFITIFLAVYYMYATDYQPQGRYIFPILVGVSIIVSVGIDKLVSMFKKFKSFNRIKIATYVVLILMIVTCYISANETFVNSFDLYHDWLKAVT